VTFTGEDVAARLEDLGVRLDRPLTEADVRRVEKRYGFTFGPDHRALLRVALPVGDTWVNWRHASPEHLRARLARPAEELMARVRAGFWAPAWGPRPDDAEPVAAGRLAQAPALLPLYADRYLPAAPAPAGSPVLALGGGAVAVQAKDLLHYVDVEFSGAAGPGTPAPAVDFWSELTVVR
jgi:hypothetical protein